MAISTPPSGASTPSQPDDTRHRSKQSMWHRLGFAKWLGRDGDDSADDADYSSSPRTGIRRTLSKRVGVGLPRVATFRRVNSERRDNLEPAEPDVHERRAVSHDRRRTQSAQRSLSPIPQFQGRLSCPETRTISSVLIPSEDNRSAFNNYGSSFKDSDLPSPFENGLTRERSEELTAVSTRDNDLAECIEKELDKKWILNLSMHFRDKSEREKFFITYAETSTNWRRVTISCDYRDAPPDSLESDLKELRYQRDKSARIYESIRDSLPDIQFYDTVTNLKLETSDGRLHVHVTEDMNEIIPYPPESTVSHIETRLIPESQLGFDSHLSGFVYKVKYGEQMFIKKEIPGPDTVDEFLYEVNALNELAHSNNVIRLEGIVIDDVRECIKGLLISYAEQGALVDIIYENKGKLSWDRRAKWARQVVEGLADIHEAGFVQGDFTLSNIVVDVNDDACLIDINRRGCPVGWEPPEISKKIASNQRISMYIGVKSDIFQLGMTLWAMAMEEDEPERHDRPLSFEKDSTVPKWFQELALACLKKRPQERPAAKDLIEFFPAREDSSPADIKIASSRTQQTPKQYIDPSAAVEREDIARFSDSQPHCSTRTHSVNVPTYVGESNSSIGFVSLSSSYVGSRGRSPPRDPYMTDAERAKFTLEQGPYQMQNLPHFTDMLPDSDKHLEIMNLDSGHYLVSKESFATEDFELQEKHPGSSIRESSFEDFGCPVQSRRGSFERRRELGDSDLQTVKDTVADKQTTGNPSEEISGNISQENSIFTTASASPSHLEGQLAGVGAHLSDPVLAPSHPPESEIDRTTPQSDRLDLAETVRSAEYALRHVFPDRLDMGTHEPSSLYEVNQDRPPADALPDWEAQADSQSFSKRMRDHIAHAELPQDATARSRISDLGSDPPSNAPCGLSQAHTASLALSHSPADHDAGNISQQQHPHPPVDLSATSASDSATATAEALVDTLASHAGSQIPEINLGSGTESAPYTPTDPNHTSEPDHTSVHPLSSKSTDHEIDARSIPRSMSRDDMNVPANAATWNHPTKSLRT